MDGHAAAYSAAYSAMQAMQINQGLGYQISWGIGCLHGYPVWEPNLHLARALWHHSRSHSTSLNLTLCGLAFLA